MILKSIHCFPYPEQFEEYLSKQRVWNDQTFSRERVGSYLMAISGTESLLLIEWPDQTAVDRFMTGTHEELMERHDLSAYLSSYQVRYWDLVGELARAPEWDQIVVGQSVVRLTKCEVPLGALAAFLAVQDQAEGFLGGRVWLRQGAPTEVLLVGFYREGAVPVGAHSEGMEIKEYGVKELRYRPQ